MLLGIAGRRVRRGRMSLLPNCAFSMRYRSLRLVVTVLTGTAVPVVAQAPIGTWTLVSSTDSFAQGGRARRWAALRRSDRVDQL